MLTSEVVKLLALSLVWCSMGLYREIAGPTLFDIGLIFNATYEEVSLSVSGRGAGGLAGAFIGGFVVDRFSNNLDLVIGICETVAALAIAWLPFAPGIETVWIHYFILGIMGAVVTMAVTRLVITMCPEKTASVLQLMNVGYGVGAFTVPIVVNQFLAKIRHLKHHGLQTDDDFIVKQDSRVHLGYVIIGLVTAAISLPFYYYHFKPPPIKEYSTIKTTEMSPNACTSKQTFCEKSVPATHARGQLKYVLFVFTLVFLFYVNIGGSSEMFPHFVRSYSVEVFHFSKTKASYLNTIFWLGLSVGRTVMAFIALYVPTRPLFRKQIILHAVATTLMNTYASSSPTMLWICTFSEGFLISPLYSTGIAYTNTLLEVSGVCLMIVQVAASIGDLGYIWLIGKLYQTIGPVSVLYSLQLTGVLLIVIAILFRVLERFKKDVEKDSNTPSLIRI